MPSVVTWLEMPSAAAHQPAPLAPALRVERALVPQGLVNRFFYQLVGGPWQWSERLPHDEAAWQAWAADPRLETWIATAEGSPAGYCELLHHPADGSLEIKHFGLAPAFCGRGLGPGFLSRIIAHAWSRQPARLWLHTCDRDHPAALRMYQGRGFTITHTTLAG